MLSLFLIIRAETLRCQRFWVKMRFRMSDFSDYAKSVLSVKASFVHFYAAHRRTPDAYIHFCQKRKLTFSAAGSTIFTEDNGVFPGGLVCPGDAIVFLFLEYFARYDMSIHEECGVFGVISPHPTNAAQLVYYGLYALQHRGQESCGIVVNDDGVLPPARTWGW